MYEDQYTLHVLKIMTSSLYTLRYDEGKVTRSYHNEINEALCGKILKMYPAKDKFNTKNSILNVHWTYRRCYFYEVLPIRMITNDYIDTRSYNTNSFICVLSMPGAIYFAWNFIESTNSCDVCYYFMYHTNFPSVIKKNCEPSVFYF